MFLSCDVPGEPLLSQASKVFILWIHCVASLTSYYSPTWILLLQKERFLAIFETQMLLFIFGWSTILACPECPFSTYQPKHFVRSNSSPPFLGILLASQSDHIFIPQHHPRTLFPWPLLSVVLLVILVPHCSALFLNYFERVWLVSPVRWPPEGHRWYTHFWEHNKYLFWVIEIMRGLADFTMTFLPYSNRTTTKHI